MKRTFKRIMAFALAAVMMLAMTATVFAAGVTVKVDEGLGDHSFTAYQIFAGTQAVDADGKISEALGDVEWGGGIKGEELLTALKENDSTNFGTCETAADVAAVLGEKAGNDSALAKAFAKEAYKHIDGAGTALQAGANTLDEGYYLIVDITSTDGADDASNAALLQVTGNEITIKVKTDKPSVEKKVKENTKYTSDDNYGPGYNDVADYNIGDEVPFAFYSKVPDMTYYDTYKFVLHDTMSAGLTFAPNSVKVTIGGDELAASEYTVKENSEDGCTFEIVISDLKTATAAAAGTEIRVDFTAELNDKAVIGLDGNTNMVQLEFSNNPNASSGTGEDQTGKTPEDKVIVFTYELDGTKVDGTTLGEDGKITDATKKLAGAEFKLYREVNGKKEYVTLNSEFVVTGWEYGNATDTAENTNGTSFKSDVNGLFHVKGLDDGTYYLEEIKAPDGYNKLKDAVEVVVHAVTANGQMWTSGTAGDALTDHTSGIFEVTVENNAGALLPSTGGIGTTVFYIVGILVMAGAVFFFAMSRKKKEN